MVFFMQQNLRPHLKIRHALTRIFGIGRVSSKLLCARMGFKPSKLVGKVNVSQLDRLARVINHFHMTGRDLQRYIHDEIARFVRISCYKGFRFMQGLPVRGQRTHTNAHNTRKKQKPIQPRKAKKKK